LFYNPFCFSFHFRGPTDSKQRSVQLPTILWGRPSVALTQAKHLGTALFVPAPPLHSVASTAIARPYFLKGFLSPWEAFEQFYNVYYQKRDYLTDGPRLLRQKLSTINSPLSIFIDW